jgi:hypothetical protein
MKFLLYGLLQTLVEDIPEIRAIIQLFLAGKPINFFKFFQADLLIFLAHHQFLTYKLICEILFNRSRRENYRSSALWTWLHWSSLNDPIILNFLRDEFSSFHVYTIKENQCFKNLFENPGHFFTTLLGTPDILKNSEILVKEMEKFFHLFFWSTNIFSLTPNQLLALPLQWRILLVQLYRCEPESLLDHSILKFVGIVLNIQNVRFDKNLFDVMSIYVTEVVAKSSHDIKRNFLNWLLLQNQDMSILAHFQLTTELIQFAQRSFQCVHMKRALFWSLFLNNCVREYQGHKRNFKIDMGFICNENGLQTTDYELNLRNQETQKQFEELYSLFGIIHLSMKFGEEFTVNMSFPNVACCQTLLHFESLHPFRTFVIKMKMIFAPYTRAKPVSMITRERLSQFIKTISDHQAFIQQLTDIDRQFLKLLFSAYLPTFNLTDELLQHLRELSLLLPLDVRRAMFECCRPLEILDNETKRLAEEQADASCGRKRIRDPSDPNSYEAKCSSCEKYYILTEIGVDHSGFTVCRGCSQSRGIVICTLLNRMPFASIEKN